MVSWAKKTRDASVAVWEVPEFQRPGKVASSGRASPWKTIPPPRKGRRGHASLVSSTQQILYSLHNTKFIDNLLLWSHFLATGFFIINGVLFGPNFVSVMMVPRVTSFWEGRDIAPILPTAAAVLDVGRLVQSPIPNTFGNLLCCRVSLSTSTQPAASATGLILRTSGELIGGVTCSISYYKKGEHPNLWGLPVFLQPHKLSPTSLTHTLDYGCILAAWTTTQLVLILIHTLSKIIVLPCIVVVK